MPNAKPVALLTGGAEGIGRAVAPRHHAAGAGFGHGGHQPPQLGCVNQLLVDETEGVQFRDAGAACLELCVILRDQNLAVAFEAAVVIKKLLNPLPDSHRADRKRNLGDVPCELTDASGVHARGVTAGIILLDQYRLHAGQRQMKRG